MLKYLILLSPCFVCLYSAIILFINRKSNVRQQNMWGLSMFSLFICSTIWALFYVGANDFSLYYKLDIIDTASTLLVCPFVFLYFRSITNNSPLSWKEYIHFSPALFIGISSLLLYARMGEVQATRYMQALLTDYTDLKEFTAPVYKMHYAINVVLYYILFIGQAAALMIYALRQITNYRKRLEEFYSTLNGKSLENMKAVLIGAFLLSALWLLGIFLNYLFYNEYPWITYLLFICYAAVLFYINYSALNVTYTIEELEADLQQLDEEAEKQGYASVETVENNGKTTFVIKKEKREAILNKLNLLLDEDKIFLRKDLRMDDVVRLTHANRTYISMLINEEYGCNFSEFINRKRINYAQQLVTESPNLSHIQIAEESGFANTVAFSRSFKQCTGITFRQWRQEFNGQNPLPVQSKLN